MANGNGIENNGDGSGLSGLEIGTGGNPEPINVDRGEPLTIDPATLSASRAGTVVGNDGDRSGSGGGKRRGRKPGSGRKSATQANGPFQLNAVSNTLFSIHAMLAVITKSPLLALEKTEADLLAQATADVARHYDIVASQKAMDWTALFSALGMVYGTRILTARLSREKKPKPPVNAPLPTEPAFKPGQGFIPGADIDPNSPIAMGIRRQ